MRTRVKICGITRAQDALAAAQAGADAIGLVFDPTSPRCVSIERALAIVRGLPPFVAVVGLFVDAEPAQVEAVLARARIDLLQFHGAESPEQCRAFARPYIKAIRMHPQLELARAIEPYEDACGILLDAYVPGRHGGTGVAFDWARVPRALSKPLILAGGLHSGNVAEAIARLRPYAVDVSSGVEASPGIKDPDKIASFLEAVRGMS